MDIIKQIAKSRQILKEVLSEEYDTAFWMNISEFLS